MGIGSVAGAFVAGVLTVLSPCVLPILPIVLGAAACEHKYGPAALAAGLAVSFVAVGLFVATIGYSIGLTARSVSPDRCRADDRPWCGTAASEPAGPLGFGQRTDRELDRSPLWHAARRRLCRSIFGWTDPRRGVEPMRRSDARRRLTVGGARPATAAGRRQHVRVRSGRGTTLARHRSCLARGAATLARTSPRGGPGHESGIRRAPYRLRRTRIDGHRQARGDNARECLMTDLTTRF